MTVALAPVALRACSTVSKIGIPSKFVPPLPGTTPPTIWVPYSLHARVWIWPVAPVIPCVRTRVFLLTSTLILLSRFHGAAGGVGHVSGGDYRDPRIPQNLFALIDVGPFHPDHQRDTEFDLARRIDDALREHVAQHDTAEDIHQHRFDPIVGEQDTERRRDFLRIGAAAHVEEVGWLR